MVNGINHPLTRPLVFPVTGVPVKTGSKVYLVSGKPEGEATGWTADRLLRALKLKSKLKSTLRS